MFQLTKKAKQVFQSHLIRFKFEELPHQENLGHNHRKMIHAEYKYFMQILPKFNGDPEMVWN